MAKPAREGAGFISPLNHRTVRCFDPKPPMERVPGNVTNDANSCNGRRRDQEPDGAGSRSAGALRRRILTASIRFCRTDSTRIE